MEARSHWTLFRANEVKDLHELYGKKRWITERLEMGSPAAARVAIHRFSRECNLSRHDPLGPVTPWGSSLTPCPLIPVTMSMSAWLCPQTCAL